MNTRDKISAFLAENKLCVLATSSLKSVPEAATVEYAEEGLDLYFTTYTRYEKYANIMANPHVAVVITKSGVTLQMKGTVKLLIGKDAEIRAKLIAKGHDHNEYFNDKDSCYFKFSPTKIKIMVDPKYPPKYEELRL